MMLRQTILRLSRRLLVLAAMSSLAVSCVDDVAFGTTPVIEFVSISPASVRGRDIAGAPDSEVRIILNYTDGDGDIGGNDASRPTLFLADTRSGFPYFVQNSQGGQTRIDSTSAANNVTINPVQDRVSPITGQITIRLANLTFVPARNAVPPVLPFPTRQQVRFRIRITDRAGNVSNTILTPAIEVRD